MSKTATAPKCAPADACKALFGRHPEDVLLPLQSASEALEWLHELLGIIIQDAKAIPHPARYRVVMLAEAARYIACDVGNYAAGEHEEMDAALTKAKGGCGMKPYLLTHIHWTGCTTAAAQPQGEQLLPPAGDGPAFTADRIVGAARTLSALIRAGKAMGMSDARAAFAANAATLRVTGVNLADELGCCIPEALPVHEIEADFEVQCRNVLRLIEKSGERGLTRHEIARDSRKWQSLDIDEREAVLDALVKNGKVCCYLRGGIRGKKGEAFIAKQFSKEAG